MRLGLKTLCDLVLEASMHLRVFRSAAYTETMERLRRQCTATAHLSRIILDQSSTELEQACLQSHTQIDRSSERARACARETLSLTGPPLELIQRDAENLRDSLP